MGCILRNVIFSFIFFASLGCTPPKQKSAVAVFAPNLTNIPEPIDIPVELPVSETFPFSFQFHKYIWAPYADLTNEGLSVAPGWGYMAPLIVADSDNQYALLYFSCDSVKKDFYCFRLLKDGIVISSLHAMGLELLPTNIDVRNAYQPPILFFRQGKIYVVYEAGLADGSSIINMVSADINESHPIRWSYVSTFYNHSGSFNYLGGAMDSKGAIYIAGLGLSNKNVSSLDLVRISYPYDVWDSKQTIREFSRKQTPLYPHVQVRNSGEVEIMATLHNSIVCDEDGEFYSESYKAIAVFKGFYGQMFNQVWKDSASDVSEQQIGGDSCLYHNQRFPMAQFYDSKNDIVYSIVKSSEVLNIDPLNRVHSNLNFRRQFKLYANNSILIPDLAVYAGSEFPGNESIWSVTGTVLNSGEFVFAFGNDGLIPNLNYVVLISSKDLINYSVPFRLPAPDGPEHSVHFALPKKNGGGALNYLHFMHSGTVFGELNLHHRVHYYMAAPL